MAHPALQIALRVALSVMGLRLVLFYSELQAAWAEPLYWFVNLLALPVLCIYAIWPRGSYQGFLSDAKTSMKLMGLYSLLMGAFFLVYYSLIDKEFFESMHERITFQEIEAAGEEVNPEQLARQVRSFFSLRNGTAIVLAGYMVLSAFYAILFSALKRVVLYSKK